MTIAPAMRRVKPRRSRRGPIVACAAGTHSSRCRRVTPKRQQGAADRVDHQPRLIRQERDGQRRERQGEAEIAAERAQMARDRHARASRRNGRNDRNESRQHDRQDDEEGPDQRRVKRQSPTRQQSEHRSGRRERSAQIVEHLPAADRGNGARRTLRARLHRRAAEDPGQQLPVAARPAVMANRADVVAGREFLDDLDIGGEAGAREDAFEQIVAEQRRVRHPAGERGLERVDVVDALARIGAFAEQILIDVGDGRGVGIDAAHAGEDALEQRALPADRQRRRDARLQHRIAFHDPAGGRVEARPVERMRHLADQAAHRVARQSRVGVERDDVANIGGRDGRPGADVDEGGVGRAAQQPVQFVQLAALALPADPPRFAFVPDATAMQQQKAVAARRRAIAPIETRDAFRRRGDQRRVALGVLGCGSRSSRRPARNADRLPGSRGDGSPAVRFALRWPPASSAASARRRACADARERRRAAPEPAAASPRSRG